MKDKEKKMNRKENEIKREKMKKYMGKKKAMSKNE